MSRSPTADRILDTALSLAAARHWESVRLAEVAGELGVGLDAIHQHFRDKEALVDAWWDRADHHMLESAAQFDGLPLRDRVEALVFSWLDVFAPHRRTAREMLLVRLEPGHLHIQFPTLLRISRTVQWVREAAGMHEPLPWRAMDETGMSALFIATVATWLNATSDEFADHSARRRLRRGLDLRDRITGTSSD